LKEVTGGKWAIDSINNVLIANKDILLVEGKTDARYIEIALSKLREYKRDREKYSELDFIILSFGGASGLKNFIDKFNTSDNQKVIALLDKDNAGKESFCSIFSNKNIDTLTDDDFNSIHSENGIKIVFLPTINNETIFEMEDYFTVGKLKVFGKKLYQNTNFTQLKDFFDIKAKIKDKLPYECENFNKSDFKNFRKLFDLLIQIRNP
jgi:5S rRNA maturation endonuclease (ribonuclease M5)